jgi:hypothetical protein
MVALRVTSPDFSSSLHRLYTTTRLWHSTSASEGIHSSPCVQRTLWMPKEIFFSKTEMRGTSFRMSDAVYVRPSLPFVNLFIECGLFTHTCFLSMFMQSWHIKYAAHHFAGTSLLIIFFLATPYQVIIFLLYSLQCLTVLQVVI